MMVSEYPPGMGRLSFSCSHFSKSSSFVGSHVGGINDNPRNPPHRHRRLHKEVSIWGNALLRRCPKKMGMGFPGLMVWKIIPGNPKKNAFLVQAAKSIPDAWLGKMRVSPKRFRNWQEMSRHLDKYREAPTNPYWRPRNRDQIC